MIAWVPYRSACCVRGFFAEELSTRLANEDDQARAMIHVTGSVSFPNKSTRSGSVRLMALEQNVFAQLDQDLSISEGFILPVVLNTALANELHAEVNDELVFSASKVSEIAQEFLFGDRDLDKRLTTWRAKVISIADDGNLGGFHPQNPSGGGLLAYFSLPGLQRVLEAEGKINGLLVLGSADKNRWQAKLDQVLVPGDVGIKATADEDFVRIEHEAFVIPDELGDWLDEVCGDQPHSRVLTYLANDLSTGDESVAYSSVAALQAFGERPDFEVSAGTIPTDWQNDDLLVNQWLAEQLKVEVGSEVEMSFFSPDDPNFRVEKQSFRVKAILAMESLAIDNTLSPNVPGMNDASDMRSWDAPFPMQLDLVTGDDEDYWDKYGPAPKAFIGFQRGVELWASRFGSLSSVRIQSDQPAQLAEKINASNEGLHAAALGFELSDLHEMAETAASGNTDFGQLFLAFSIFIVISALMLTAMFFRLGLESRAREMGVLHAVGYTRRQLTVRYLAETGPVAVIGVLLGSVLALAYVKAVIGAIKSWWFVDFDMGFLQASASTESMVTGAVITFVVTLITIYFSLRRILAGAPSQLLAAGEIQVKKSARWLWLIATISALSLGYVVFKGLAHEGAQPALFFPAGGLMLMTGLFVFAAWLRRLAWSRVKPLQTTLGMASRSCARQPARNLTAACLVATAVFILAAVGANKKSNDTNHVGKDSGIGGYSVVATSSLPVIGDLQDAKQRMDLGMNTADSNLMDGIPITGFRVVDGEDASCLNLYQPAAPTLIAPVNGASLKGRFHFSSHMFPDLEDPWTAVDHVFADGAIPVIGDANTVMWILHSGLGKDITIEAENGEELRLRFVGLLQHSLLQSEVVVSATMLQKYYPHDSSQRMFLFDIDIERSKQLVELLERGFVDIGFDAQLTSQRLAAYHEVENTYMSVFQSLGGLGLLLGSIGLAVMMFRNVNERRSELAMMQAVGFNHTQIANVLRWEHTLVVTVGILVGLLAAAVGTVPAQLERGSSNLTSIAWMCLGVLVIGLFSGRLAIRSALKAPILTALRGQ